MRSIIFLLIILLTLSFSCRTSKPVTQPEPPASKPAEQPEVHVNYSEASTWLIGYFDASRFRFEPHAEWYIKGMDDYTFNQQAIDILKKITSEGLSIKIVLGTWCPDSRREVPRFMRILKEIDFPPESVKFIGVDNMKFSPVDNYEALGIERVPTFIFYKNNIETGRIIENPTTSLEQDMVNILAGNEKQ